MRIRPFSPLRDKARGTASVELLIVVPVLLMFLALSIDIARAMHARLTLIGALGEGVAAGARAIAEDYALGAADRDGEIKGIMSNVSSGAFTTQYDPAKWNPQFSPQIMCRCQGDTDKLICMDHTGDLGTCTTKLEVFAQLSGTLAFPLVFGQLWLPTDPPISSQVIMRGQ